MSQDPTKNRLRFGLETSRGYRQGKRKAWQPKINETVPQWPSEFANNNKAKVRALKLA